MLEPEVTATPPLDELRRKQRRIVRGLCVSRGKVTHCVGPPGCSNAAGGGA
jgi:hypothetical protein